MLPNRHGSTDNYRYGFNGKEKDDEVKGEGVQYDYGFRIYDARLGKFLSTDPLFKSFPWLTPYQFASNSPIWAIDLDGLESMIVIYGGTGIKTKVITEDDEGIDFRSIKEAYLIAFGGHEGWVSGFDEYHGTSKENYEKFGTPKGWTGPGSGVLTIDASGSAAKIKYTSLSGWETFKRSLGKGADAIYMWFFDPDPMVEGSEKFNTTFWTYTSTVALEPLVEVAIVGTITYLVRTKNAVKAYEALSKGKTTSMIGRADDINDIAKTTSNITKNTANKGGLSRLSNDPAWNKIIDKFKDIKDEKERWKKINDEWWDQYNKPWLDEVIERGDDILDVSDPSITRNLKNLDGSKTHYARERDYLTSKGYEQKGSRWVKKKG